MSHKVPAQCIVCKNGVEFELGDPKIINSVYTSVVILEHPKHQTCQNCGSVLAPGIAALQGLIIGTLQVPPEERPLIVVPPAGGIKH